MNTFWTQKWALQPVRLCKRGCMPARVTPAQTDKEQAMKFTKNDISEIISQEIDLMIQEGELDEGVWSRTKARGAGGMATAKNFFKSTDTKAGASQDAKVQSLLKGRQKQIEKIHVSLKDDMIRLGLGQSPALKKALETIDLSARIIEAALSEMQGQ